MGAVLCIMTKSVRYRLHRLCSCYGHTKPFHACLRDGASLIEN